MFGTEGYELVSVTSGREALDEVERREFAVILLDLQMPAMDGVETAQRIKERSGQLGRRVPIIIVTAIDIDRSRILQVYGAGAADFMQKPLEGHFSRAKVGVFADLYRSPSLATEAARRLERLLEVVREFCAE